MVMLCSLWLTATTSHPFSPLSPLLNRQILSDNTFVKSWESSFLSNESEVNHWKTSLVRTRRQWHPTPLLLPGKSHGQRSLVGYSPWCCEESDATERLHFNSFHWWIQFYQFPFPIRSIQSFFSECFIHLILLLGGRKEAIINVKICFLQYCQVMKVVTFHDKWAAQPTLNFISVAQSDLWLTTAPLKKK